MKSSILFLRVTFRFSEMLQILPKIIKMTSGMYISGINIFGYLQRGAMSKVLIITMLEMIMLSLLPKVPTTIESLL